jgi:hypothetical protein
LQGAAVVPADARITAFGSVQTWGSGVQVGVSAPKDHGPSSSLLPGRDAMFTAAFSLPAASGELRVEVTPELGADRASFAGRL